MARYQIRTPPDQVIEDVVQTLAEKSWAILKAWKVLESEDQKDFPTFQQAIYIFLRPFVRAYRLCGYSNICLDEALKTEWGSPISTCDAEPRDLIYHLFPGKGLEEFLDGLSGAALESISQLINADMMEEVQSILRTAFRAILGEYLYFNPLCGKTELCLYSSASPQKVWERQ